MRLSRKRARRIAEERAKEEAQARAEAERAAKAAAAAQARYEAACKGATMPSRRYPHSRRQNRRTRRAYLLEKARAHFARQAAMTAAFSTACLTRLLGTASAGYHDPMHDVASEFASLRDERDEIRNAQAARQYLQAARESLANARHDLADATAAVADAQTSVADATKNLADSQQALAQTKEYLRNARAVSAQRTREAIAAQQAAYDYLQELYARQAMVDQLSAEQASLEAQVDAASEGYASAGRAYQEASNREAAVQKALAEVGYEQNRLTEAIRLADEYTAAHGATEDAGRVAEEAAANADAVSARLDEVSAALDDAEASLDEAQAYLEELEDARRDAEEAEAEARADEREVEQDEQEAERYGAESEKSLDEAHAYEADAHKWEQEAKQLVADAAQDEEETARNLWQIGTGAGMQMGIEYAHVKGEERGTAHNPDGYAERFSLPHRGHQLFFPFSVYDTERLDPYPGSENVTADGWPHGQTRHQLDLGISTGWLSSRAGVLPLNDDGPQVHEDGGSSGLIDTTVFATYHNDHPIGSTRYGLIISMPTGQSRFYQSALVPKGLGLFEDFGNGWQFAPNIETIYRATERDSVSARLAYIIRRSYNFSREFPAARTDPGNQTTLDLSYRHIGEQHQLHAWATLISTERTTQDQPAPDEEGNWRISPHKVHYREGEEFELGAAANWQVTPKDELGLFGSYGHAMRARGISPGRATDTAELAVSLHHQMTPRLSWEGIASYCHSTTGYNSLYIDEDGWNNDPWDRWSLLGVLDWKVTDYDRLTLNIERYLRHGLSEADYQGYAVARWYSRAF